MRKKLSGMSYMACGVLQYCIKNICVIEKNNYAIKTNFDFFQILTMSEETQFLFTCSTSSVRSLIKCRHGHPRPTHGDRQYTIHCICIRCLLARHSYSVLVRAVTKQSQFCGDHTSFNTVKISRLY